MAKIGDVFSLIRNGANIKQGDDDSGFPITRIETIANRVIDRNRMGYAGITDISKYESYVLQDGDILMSHINSEAHLGKVALYDKRHDEIIIHGMNLLCLRPKIEILNPRYAYYYFSSGAFLRQLPNITKKSVNQASFNISALKELNIAVPNMEKQNQITKVLNAIEVLVQMRLKQLSHLDQLVKSQFIEMFGDPMLNSKNWPVHQLSEHIEFLTSGSRGWAKYFTDDGEYFITIKNVKDCRITLDDIQHINPPDNAEAKRTKVQAGDLLISITADLGRTGVVSEEIAEHGAYINQHLTCIRLDQNVLDPLYTAYYMESEAGKSQFESKNQSAVKAGLNFNSINSLKVMIPPMELQKSFIQFIEQADKSKFAIQQSLEQLETMKKSLMQEYFG